MEACAAERMERTCTMMATKPGIAVAGRVEFWSMASIFASADLTAGSEAASTGSSGGETGQLVGYCAAAAQATSAATSPTRGADLILFNKIDLSSRATAVRGRDYPCTAQQK